MINVVYKIEHNNKPIYYGRTKNLKRRIYQHNYNLRTNKGGKLYDYCRENDITELELIVVRECKTVTESKRYEMYLILDNLFNPVVDLYQSIPSISDR